MLPATLRFDDQVVLVTGGATGLGLAIADAFGRAGARIALNDRAEARLARAGTALDDAGIAWRGYPADVRDAGAVGAMLDEIDATFGGPDIVVANAGIYPNTPFLDLSEEEWDRVLDTNLKGIFLTCQAAARVMVKRGRGGQIITVSSGAANTAYWGWAHYCTSKAAVVMLTKAMALELGQHGIRVNAVLPGYIDVEEGGRQLDDAYKSAARAAVPLGRPGAPQDIARAILLLASPLAAYVSGAVVAVDGGSSAGRLAMRPGGQ
ncbi:MAG: SDR family oxidoreductase [Chloroflexota bacterium]|nr:SDR family oxidoreductase [Chloroflexota bacterium]